MKTENFCLGHKNFGQLTTHVPAQNFKQYADLSAAQKDCEEIKKRNPSMRVLICTTLLGTPVKFA
jgi:hypothetical protein